MVMGHTHEFGEVVWDVLGISDGDPSPYGLSRAYTRKELGHQSTINGPISDLGLIDGPLTALLCGELCRDASRIMWEGFSLIEALQVYDQNICCMHFL